MRKNKQIVKHIFSLALIFTLLLGFMPGGTVISAKAEESSATEVITIDTLGLVEGTSASDEPKWTFDGETLTLKAGYSFTTETTCYFWVENYSTIVGGDFIMM